MSTPLNLAQFQGFTRGPWTTDASNCAGGVNIHAPKARVGHSARFVRAGVEIVTDAEAASNATLMAAAPALLAECRRQREEIARLRDALADADAHLRRALVATVDTPDLTEAREDLHAGRNMVREALNPATPEAAR